MAKRIAIIGGGAAGFFAAIECGKQTKLNGEQVEIIIFEMGKDVLQKVRISGGGRCNATHACWTPKELVKHYPRGSKELLGPFNSFCCGDTVEWFANHGVELKIEADGRMFPVTDSSQTIIACLLKQAEKYKINIRLKHKLTNLKQLENGNWLVSINKERNLEFDKVMMATGSAKSMWQKLEHIGLKTVGPVPSLFTFNIKDERINNLMGLSVTNANIKILGTKLEAAGPLLITHWGLSGPAILRLSAWGARQLHERNYDFQILVNFTGFETQNAIKDQLLSVKTNQKIYNVPQYSIPKRLWHSLLAYAKIPEERTWKELGSKQANKLAATLSQSVINVKGKSTFKDEFVTAGGVDLKEINFKRFESKQFPNLYFAGEVLNIDAITGGFNFQAAWTGGFIAGQAMAD